MVIFDHFESVFLDFIRNGTLQRAEVLCVTFSASKPFFWAILINIPTIFLIFHPKGRPLWFWGGQKLPEVEKIERKKNPPQKIWKIGPNGTGTWVVEVSTSQMVLSGTLYCMVRLAGDIANPFFLPRLLLSGLLSRNVSVWIPTRNCQLKILAIRVTFQYKWFIRSSSKVCLAVYQLYCIV